MLGATGGLVGVVTQREILDQEDSETRIGALIRLDPVVVREHESLRDAADLMAVADVGRLPVVATLEELDEEALVRILIEPKNALVKQYKQLFLMEGVELEIREDALQAVARKAMAPSTRPDAMPAPSTIALSRRTRRMMSRAVAPSEARMPNSRVRWADEYATMPYSPRHARASPIVAAAARIPAASRRG